MIQHPERSGFAPPDNNRYRYSDGTIVDSLPGYHPHHSTRFINWNESLETATPQRKLPELYIERAECCGCTACCFSCPTQSITMEPDEEGFLYPVIDASSCIRCGKCLDACVFKKTLTKKRAG